MSRFLLFLPVLLPLALVGQDPRTAADEYRSLNEQVLSHRRSPGQTLTVRELHDITGGLKGIVRNVVAANGTAEALPQAHAVRAGIAGVQGELAFDKLWKEDTNTPFADVIKTEALTAMVTGFVLLRGGMAVPDTVPVLDFWVRHAGGWERVAEAGSELRGCTFFVHRVDSGSPSRLWYVAAGRTLGDTGTRLKLVLYSFDGNSVQVVGSKDSIRAGRLERVEGNELVVSYLDESHAYAPQRATMRLRATANGLEP